MDVSTLLWWAVFGASLTSFLADLRAHRINRDFLEFAGSSELDIGTKVSICYFAAVHGLILISLGISYWRDIMFSEDLNQLLLGFFLMLAGFVFRQWAMRSIGRLWSLKCLYIPSMPLENRGLYRVLSHPEYVCRGMESLGVMMVLGTKDQLWPLWMLTMVLGVLLGLLERRFVTQCAQSGEPTDRLEAF
jgi:isoprenylcysteine carboxyl methyltransferase (ICMT) family protein YpbQ